VITNRKIYKALKAREAMEKNFTNKIVIAILVAAIVIVSAVLASVLLKFDLITNLVMSWVLTAFYALFAFFLVDPVIQLNPVKTVEKPVYQEVVKLVEKPVIKEIQVPVENTVIKVVEKEVPVEKIVYKEIPHRKLNIPKFKFIGSTQTRTYHARNCKFSKMLKRKFKLHSNSRLFFKKKHYKACRTCLKNQK